MITQMNWSWKQASVFDVHKTWEIKEKNVIKQLFALESPRIKAKIWSVQEFSEKDLQEQNTPLQLCSKSYNSGKMDQQLKLFAWRVRLKSSDITRQQ